MSVVQTFTNLPTKQKIIVGVVALILVIVAVIVVRKMFRKPNAGGQQGGTQDHVGDDINLNQQAQSYQNSQYAIWADQLEVAMQDAGTDDDAIYYIMEQMLNDKDVLKLVQAFGTRGYNGSIIWIPAPWRSQLSLGGFFGEELRVSELQRVNDILASKGIQFRF